MNPENPAKATPRNLTVDRALRVLEAFLGKESQLGVVELSRQLGLDKSVIHRILTTLAQRRFIEQDPVTRRYQIGLRVWELGQRHKTGHQLRDLAERELAAATRLHPYTTGYLSMLDATDVVVVATVRGPGPINLYIEPGTHIVAELPTTGQVLLAWQPATRLAAVVNNSQRIRPGESPADLIAKLATIRAQGYGSNRDGPHTLGIGTVAAPIRDHDGQAMAAVTIDFLINPQTRQLWDTVPGELVAAASRIEHVINAPHLDQPAQLPEV